MKRHVLLTWDLDFLRTKFQLSINCCANVRRAAKTGSLLKLDDVNNCWATSGSTLGLVLVLEVGFVLEVDFLLSRSSTCRSCSCHSALMSGSAFQYSSTS